MLIKQKIFNFLHIIPFGSSEPSAGIVGAVPRGAYLCSERVGYFRRDLRPHVTDE